MKEIQIAVRIDEVTNQVGHIMKHKGFGPGEDIDVILTTIGVLDNLKQQFLNKLLSKSRTVK